jgi:hypothetical protein
MKIEFELTDDKIDLHELLCKAIHENDMEALKKLSEVVVDIKEVE